MKELADLILFVSGIIMAFVGLRTSKGKIDGAMWVSLGIFNSIGLIVYYYNHF